MLHVSIVIMDRVQQSLNKVEEMMEQFKSVRDNLDLKIKLYRSKTSPHRKWECTVIDRYILATRAEYNKQTQTGYEKWASSWSIEWKNL